MANLAFTWKEQGRDPEAVGLMRECVRLQERVLGASHPHFISSSNALATLCLGRASSGASSDGREPAVGGTWHAFCMAFVWEQYVTFPNLKKLS